MNNTEKSFSDKWHNNPDLGFAETLREGSDFFDWILTRNGFKNGDALKNYLSDKKRILDAGCGNGRVSALLREHSDQKTTEIHAIDLVAHEIAKKNLSNYSNIFTHQKNLLQNLSDLGKFDFIYCQEVLHHTGNPQAAFNNLVELLDDKGEIAIYVYKKKAPIRENVDDFVRDKIAGMSYEEAYKVCEQITALGKTLSDLNLKINVPDIDILEIKAGEYDVQRFFYHFFMKCYWNNDLSFKDCAVINYDWYHPQDCTKHTVEEVRNWFREAGLKITQEHVDFYGITMRGIK